MELGSNSNVAFVFVRLYMVNKNAASDRKGAGNMENDTLNAVAGMSDDYLAMVEEMQNGKGCLSISKTEVGYTFTTPMEWWKAVVNEDDMFGAFSDESQLVQATWQSKMLAIVLTELYNVEPKATVLQLKNGKSKVAHLVTYEMLQGANVRVVYKTQEVIRHKAQMNIAISSKKTELDRKVDRLAEYQAGMMLLLLRKKVKLGKSDNDVVFVKPSDWQTKNNKRQNKSDYSVLATADMKKLLSDRDYSIRKMDARVTVLDKDGKKLNYHGAAAKAVGLKGKVGWDEINDAAIKNGCAQVVYPTVADYLNHSCEKTPTPFGLIASLSRTDSCKHQSRVLNFKVLLGADGGRFFENDSKGLDKAVLTGLRENITAMGIQTTRKDDMKVFEVKDVLPDVKYLDDRNAWNKAMDVILWQPMHAIESRDADWKRWSNITPIPSIEFGWSGCDATFAPLDLTPVGGSNGYRYPLFDLVLNA